MSQTQQILRHLKSGKSLTPLSALNLYDCLRLSGRVLELRERGWPIKTEKLKLTTGKTVANYRLGSP